MASSFCVWLYRSGLRQVLICWANSEALAWPLEARVLSRRSSHCPMRPEQKVCELLSNCWPSSQQCRMNETRSMSWSVGVANDWTMRSRLASRSIEWIDCEKIRYRASHEGE